ncbi:MAG: hypothetical protein ACRCSV_02375 [Chlamydiales bacterium]
MKRFHKIGSAVIFLSMTVTAVSSLFVRKSGFALSKIHSPNPYDGRWDIPMSIEDLSEIRAILSQKFTYLASGNHCYTFVSDDDDYVIKFFKQKQITPISWKNYLPIPSRRLIRENRQKYRDKTYGSYVIAATKLKSETGTVYLHLTKSHHFSHKLLLIDQYRRIHSIDLNHAEFLVQKRAQIGFSYLDRMLAQAKVQEAARAIDSLFSLISRRCALGILDDDCQLWKNFGFREGRAIEVDIGEFRYGSLKEIAIDLEMDRIADQMSHWIDEHYPEYHFLITEALDNAAAKCKNLL